MSGNSEKGIFEVYDSKESHTARDVTKQGIRIGDNLMGRDYGLVFQSKVLDQSVATRSFLYWENGNIAGRGCGD